MLSQYRAMPTAATLRTSKSERRSLRLCPPGKLI